MAKPIKLFVHHRYANVESGPALPRARTAGTGCSSGKFIPLEHAPELDPELVSHV